MTSEATEALLWERLRREVVLDNMICLMASADGRIISQRDGGRLEEVMATAAAACMAKKLRRRPSRTWTIAETLQRLDRVVFVAARRWLERRERLLALYVNPAIRDTRRRSPERILSQEVFWEMQQSHLELLDDGDLSGRLNHEELLEFSQAMARFSFHVMGWEA